MNHRPKSNNGDNAKYRSLYFKKLQTQNSMSNDNLSSFQETSFILEKQLTKISSNLHKKHALFNKTIRNKKEIQNQLVLQRDSLKSKIQQKMRKSQNNMLSHRQKSNSSLSSRLKQQNKKIQQIKRMQKTMYDQKYEKSKELSNQTEKFFKNLQEKRKRPTKQISLDTSFLLKTRNKSPLFSPAKRSLNKYSFQKSYEKQSRLQNPQKVKPFLASLKNPRSSALEKQIKKIQQQKLKQRSFLRDYVKKMETIEKSRKNAQIQRKLPQRTIAKSINRQYDQQQLNSKKKFSKSSVKQAVNNKSSFSQLYNKKLQQKKDKKSFFLSQSLAAGQKILKEDHMQATKFKLNKLIRQSQNQLARKQNFRYMQKFLNKVI